MQLCVFCLQPAFSQRKYYEFNNPADIKLTSEKIDLLTSTTWQAKKMRVIVRQDMSDYNIHDHIAYNPDGTYQCRKSAGTWTIKYNRYLVLKANQNAQERHNHPIEGIFAVTNLNDSSLWMMKLHSSTGDMKRELVFRKKSPYKRNPTDTVVINWRQEIRTPLGDTDLDPYRKIFDENESVNFSVLPARYEVPTDQLNIIDSLILTHISSTEKYSELRSLRGYFRQYVGYVDAGVNHIIYVNAFLDYNTNWRQDFIKPSGGNEKGFQIFVNLTKLECFGLHINGQ